jgi:hypothetical protein
MSLRLFGFSATRDTNQQQIGNRLRPTQRTYIIPKTFLTLNPRLMMTTVTADTPYDEECFLSASFSRPSLVHPFLQFIFYFSISNLLSDFLEQTLIRKDMKRSHSLVQTSESDNCTLCSHQACHSDSF